MGLLEVEGLQAVWIGLGVGVTPILPALGLGLDGNIALDAVNITVNKNTIPFDTNKPFIASGIRLGTPALTTRGMKEAEMRQIGEMIAAVIGEPESEEIKGRVRREVAEITARFPMYPTTVGREDVNEAAESTAAGDN